MSAASEREKHRRRVRRYKGMAGACRELRIALDGLVEAVDESTRVTEHLARLLRWIRGPLFTITIPATARTERIRFILFKWGIVIATGDTRGVYFHLSNYGFVWSDNRMGDG